MEWADIVKGYQYTKGDYVVLSDEDFRQANVKATQTIDIAQFVGARGHSARVLRNALFPGARQRRREGVCAAARMR